MFALHDWALGMSPVTSYSGVNEEKLTRGLVGSGNRAQPGDVGGGGDDVEEDDELANEAEWAAPGQQREACTAVALTI